MRHTMLTLVLLCCGAVVWGKGTASLSGKVTDEDGKPLTDVRISLKKGRAATEQILKAGGDGTYKFINLDSGEYSALIVAAGRESQHITGINVKREALVLNARLSKSGTWGSSILNKHYVEESAQPGVISTHARPLGHISGTAFRESYKTSRAGGRSVEVHATRAYMAPIIDPESPGGRSVKTAEAIDRAPTRSTSDIATLSTEVYRSGSGASLSVAGGRASGAALASPSIVDASEHASIVAVSAEMHAGMLTSGEINDFSKWTLWEDMSMDALKGYRTTWPFKPEMRYSVLVKSKNGAPLCNARVKMSNGSGQVWEAVTDNTGKAELWFGMWNVNGDMAPKNLSATVEYGKDHFSLSALHPFSEGPNILSTNLSCLNPAKLDIAFLVDATGSMQDEINYLKAELRDILQKVHDSMPGTQVQTGALFYRDLSDAYLTRTSDLTPDFDKTEAFIADNGADGGGDFPEAVDAALEEGLDAFHWRPDATARLAFLVLDAPPHSDAATVKRIQELTAQYAALGIRIIPVVCSGSDKPTEYLMRSIALATNGTYLFLTDHSGIGGSHTAPTTDKYDVEYLNGLIYRVIYQCAYMPSCNEKIVAKTDTSDVQQRTDSATTINWRYYPNPTTGILHIQHTNTSGYLLVTDVTGKAILRIPADGSGTTTIDLSQYPAGLYAIRYNWADDKWVSGKFVLVH